MRAEADPRLQSDAEQGRRGVEIAVDELVELANRNLADLGFGSR